MMPMVGVVGLGWVVWCIAWGGCSSLCREALNGELLFVQLLILLVQFVLKLFHLEFLLLELLLEVEVFLLDLILLLCSEWGGL